MRRYILQILIAILVLTGSCAGRKNKVVHKDAIPDRDLVSILTEIHIADGLLSLPDVNYRYSDRDTLSAYIDIIEKHGYTKEMMDRTMRYYFIKKPKKLIKIYDMVLGALSEMESRIDKEMPSFRDNALNLWQGKQFYNFPDRNNDSAWIDFPLSYPGAYNLKFTLTIYPDDEISVPKAGIFLFYPDTVKKGERAYLSKFPFLKDGMPHKYNFAVTVKKSVPPVRLMGWFVDQENQAPWREKHLRIDSVILSRSLIQ